MSFEPDIIGYKIGATTAITFAQGVSNATLLLSGTPILQTQFGLRSDQDVWVKQGGSTVSASTTNAIFLKANVYFVMNVESSADVYIATYGDSAAGTLAVTNLSRIT